MAARAASAPVALHGAQQMGSGALEGDWGKFGRGVVETAGGVAGLKEHVPTPEVVPTPTPRPRIVPPVEPPKPSHVTVSHPTPEGLAKLKADGYVPTGVLSPEGYPVMRHEPKPPGPMPAAQLPRSLRGGTPKYNYGRDSFDLTFANDTDKALFIIANAGKKSAKDAGYLKFAMEQTGLSEGAARAKGRELKAIIREQAENAQGPGQLKIDPFHKPTISGGSAPPPPPKDPNITGGDIPFPKKPTTPKKEGMITQLENEVRTLIASIDFSGPGRQALPLSTKKEFWTSFDDMFKSWGSDKGYEMVMDSIKSKPLFQDGLSAEGSVVKSAAKRAGLELGEITAGKEEVFKGRIVSKYIPGVKRSDRAYSGFLNKLRADTFESLVNKAERLGKDPLNNDVLLKQIGDFINTSTGRGRLGSLEPAAKVLSHAFFAPRLMASRIQTYTNVFNPRYYARTDPMIRKEAWKALLSVVGVGTAMGQLGKLAGADVDFNPTSSDFGKMKFGNVRLDPYGGFQQYAVAASKILSDVSTSSTSGEETELNTGKFGGQTEADVVQRFFMNKLAPIPSFVWAKLLGKEFDGQPFEVKRAILQRTVPLMLQDLYELYKEDPKLLPLAIPSAFGVGVQTYGR